MINDQHPAIGKYCIVRCSNAGIHAGLVASVTSDCVTLENSRRLWLWKTAKGISLSAVALYGVNAQESQIPAALPKLHLERSDICEFIEASAAARQTIEDMPDADAR